MWVARNSNGDLFLFYDKPYRESNYRWVIDNKNLKIMMLDSKMYPDLTWEDEPREVTLCNIINSDLKSQVAETILREYGKTNHSTDTLVGLIVNKTFNEIMKLVPVNDEPSDEILDKVITLANIFTGFYVFFAATPDQCEYSSKEKLREVWNDLDNVLDKAKQGDWYHPRKN